MGFWTQYRVPSVEAGGLLDYLLFRGAGWDMGSCLGYSCRVLKQVQTSIPVHEYFCTHLG
jgi:hypothetical protein